MNISIFASVWCQNLGDELILKNEIDLLSRELGTGTQDEVPVPLKFKIASYDSKKPFFQSKNIEYFEYFPYGIKKPKNIFRNVRNFFGFLHVILWSDIVIIGWGGIIYDSEKQSVKNPLDQWIFRTRVARLFRKKVYFYALWIDVKQKENIEKLTKIFTKAWKITVRDQKSYELLQRIWVGAEIVDDPVLQDSDQKGKILWSFSSKNFTIKNLEEIDIQGKKVGLALRSGYLWKSWNPKIENLLVHELCEYIEREGWKVVFLPHSFHAGDVLANDEIFLEQFLTLDRDIHRSMGEVYTVYNHNLVDIVISMRLHSMILAYVYGINQIALSYSQKTDEFLKKI